MIISDNCEMINKDEKKVISSKLIELMCQSIDKKLNESFLYKPEINSSIYFKNNSYYPNNSWIVFDIKKIVNPHYNYENCYAIGLKSYYQDTIIMMIINPLKDEVMWCEKSYYTDTEILNMNVSYQHVRIPIRKHKNEPFQNKFVIVQDGCLD